MTDNRTSEQRLDQALDLLDRMVRLREREIGIQEQKKAFELKLADEKHELEKAMAAHKIETWTKVYEKLQPLVPLLVARAPDMAQAIVTGFKAALATWKDPVPTDGTLLRLLEQAFRDFDEEKLQAILMSGALTNEQMLAFLELCSAVTAARGNPDDGPKEPTEAAKKDGDPERVNGAIPL